MDISIFRSIEGTKMVGNLTGGLVGEIPHFSVLPSIKPFHTLLLTCLFMMVMIQSIELKSKFC